MNQANMNAANNAARRQADMVYKQMLIAILTATLLAFLFSYLAQRWILHPIKQLFESTNEIRNGHLDLVLKTGTGDEIGRLSESFNEMASALRKVREKDRINLVRTQRATEDVFKALPSAIAVLDLDGRVEVATETAEHHFGLKPGVLVDTLGYEWLPPLIRKARDENRVAERDPKSGYVQQFIGDREYFFQPTAVPIPLDGKAQEPRGIAVLLKDVTRVQEQQELKLGVVATVLHQLRTPLTSLRMSIHLMLEERIGELNDTQSEILITAREESERLTDILDELQNLHRIESGMPDILPEPVRPITLARSAREQFLVVARDKGIELVNTVSDELPEVIADSSKIKHVFVNLLSNALRFTSPGGSITIGASAEAETVRFYVEDTGTGISEEALKHLFEKFYRAPGQDKESGVGLGLSIVKEIVRAHGGDVGVESVVGKGSVFYFTLPLRMVKTENTAIKPMEE
jgi:signal transduction histidine kinase/HAMP domain-containing protein